MRCCFIRSANGFFEYFRKMKGKLPILILAAAGVLLLLLGGGDGERESDREYDYMSAAEEYRLRLEGDVASLASRMRGVGEVYAVLITLEAGDEYVWAQNTGSGGSTDVVISNKEGLLVERKMPRVRGVSVVCSGGGSSQVKKELTDAISAALGVASSRIHISEGG